MKNKLALGAVLISGFVFFGWRYWGDELKNANAARSLNNASLSSGSRTKTGDWKSTSVQTSNGTKQILQRMVHPSIANVRHLLTASKDFVALQKELETAQNISEADRKFYQAAIEDYCFGVAVKNHWVKQTNPRYREFDEQTRLLDMSFEEASATGIPQSQPNDPMFALRNQAKLLLSENSGKARCSGFKDRNLTLAGVDARMQAAAATGDKRSAGLLAAWAVIAATTEKEVMAGSNSDSVEKRLVKVTNLPPPSSEQVGQITAALSTGDPVAILSLGHTLSQSYQRDQFYFGEQGEALELKLRDYIWPMLACEYGADCTAGKNDFLLQACANEGICDMPDLETYMKSYKLSQVEVAQYDRLRPQFINAINTGNWAFMSTVPGPLPAGAMRMLYINGLRVPVRFGR